MVVLLRSNLTQTSLLLLVTSSEAYAWEVPHFSQVSPVRSTLMMFFSIQVKYSALLRDRQLEGLANLSLFPCFHLFSLAWEGRIVVVGFAGGAIPSIPANLLLLKNIAALGLYWGRYRDQDFPVFSSALSSALSYCQEGRIHPHVGAVFKLEEVRTRRPGNLPTLGRSLSRLDHSEREYGNYFWSSGL